MHTRDSAFARHTDGFDCDVLIVGSGYGGAVSAAALSEALSGDAERRVWLLERGQAYAPGDFPHEMASLAGHVRLSLQGEPDCVGRREGLFDLRLSPDVGVVVANGLGGGSLINAGVMAWPCDEVFGQAHWPADIRQEAQALRQRSATVARQLGAQVHHASANATNAPLKFQRLNDLGQAAPTEGRFQGVAITVAQQDGVSSDGVQLSACVGCGDCATGCNTGAKISLDTNLLAKAARLGVQVITGATVLRLSPLGQGDEGWQVEVQHTQPTLQFEDGPPTQLRARRVILAAGTLGSTGILQRSVGVDFPLSPQLGQGFSGNGDMLLSVYDQHQPAQAVADEQTPAADRQIGPTITGMIDLRSGARGHVVQDLAVPGPLRRWFEEMTLTSATLHTIGKPDWTCHRGDAPAHDPLSVQPQAMARTLPLAIIGHDSAQGVIELAPANGGQHHGDPAAPHLPCDSAVTVRWPQMGRDPRLTRQWQGLVALNARAKAGGDVLPNLAWQPLPRRLAELANGVTGPMFVAHPLGGCRMGERAEDGVVDHLGRVFDPREPTQRRTYPGLVVLDGAIVPGSLGINPALTIATLSDRAIRALMTEWNFLPVDAAPPGPERPRLSAPPPTPVAGSAHQTWFDLSEQMRGWVGDVGIELTLRTQEAPWSTLMAAHPMQRVLLLDAAHCRVRVVRKPRAVAGTLPSQVTDPWTDPQALVFEAAVSGEIRAFHREPTQVLGRTWQSLRAWWHNRGLKDLSQALRTMVSGRGAARLANVGRWPAGLAKAATAVTGTLGLATQSGEVRRLDYRLQMHAPQPRRAWVEATDAHWHTDVTTARGQRLWGHKRLTYAKEANPWQQLSELDLSHFPGLVRKGRAPLGRLRLNTAYLAEIGVPLLRITRQRDMPTTLMDLSSLGLYIARLLLRTHVWSLRASEAPVSRRTAQRAAGGGGPLPPPEVSRLTTRTDAQGQAVAQVQLSCYRRPKGQPCKPRPVVLLHGYSASGSTFAHPALQGGLAAHLWTQGHEVWVVDLRTSPALPSTATLPWRFEDVALEDIPQALAHIADQSEKGQVNVLAHCMGSAMLWMALLATPGMQTGRSTAACTALQRLHGNASPLIHRLCLSQVSPCTVFSPDNRLRAFVMRYLQQFLPLGPYRFAPSTHASELVRALDGLSDRLLSLLPYPPSEWARAHPMCPPWQATPWTFTRRRMDMLYGRTFNLQQVSPEVLDHIDDFFGPMHLHTLTDVLPMAHNQAVSNREGHSLLDDAALRAALSRLDRVHIVHGADNGLSDVRGSRHFLAQAQGLGAPWAGQVSLDVIEGMGHQDCLIGTEAAQRVFPLVSRFFA